MDLSNMSSGDLRQLQKQVEHELIQRQGHDRAKALGEIQAIAASVGLPLRDLLNATPAVRVSKTGSVAPRYRNPADVTQQWTGRGRQPKWVKEWVDGGKDIDGLKI